MSSKKRSSGSGKRTKISADQNEPADIEVEVVPPQSAEDYLVEALNRTSLEEVVRILRDWHGRQEIQRCLNRLHHRNPVDRFTHIVRNAVEIYAKRHGLTPANLAVKLRKIPLSRSAAGSERNKLRRALKFIEEYPEGLVAAKALANEWERTRGSKEPQAHLKSLNPQI